ncbi:helix-turn-helix domain-containing protein [Lactobacillus delbrueckii]|nr:helix-turn-helix transcriptional regulator [Lactobacillus delbrueckii]MCD5446147.1 helix-turn-helix transcriptional regulator [Lactobacillus delbrueckii subsp. lactis]MCZ0776462.1 helix-turn-helix transcriptional regulator [Lactobacillus delbrueckii subsp. sunkii]MCZ0793517.1 helix-turn-helix transcriptional regulator [Lactobacillus delbrueckii]MDA3795851.1 helix-turn-helix transcriptional regulator [Lactobacillus delbrueckii]
MHKRNITVYRLSKLSGVKETTLRWYKQGTEPTLSNAFKIADALGVSLDDLRGGISNGRDEDESTSLYSERLD